MSETPVIECKPSKWFKIRAVLIVAMLAFFTAWFFKDGYSGYREKNLEYVSQQLFSEMREGQDDYIVNAIEVFKEKEHTAESWKVFASEQIMPVPAKDRGLLPRDYDYTSKWPEELVNGYDSLKEDKVYELWKAYSGRMKWSMEGPEKLYDEGKIKEQFIVCGICAALTLFALFISLRILGRKMVVTDEAYIAPGGVVVPFSSMKKIDKRKWDNKGLATIFYEENGESKKVKVDGMVYGQFVEEEGAPAEKLFATIIENFKGEIVEYIIEEDDVDAESEGSNNPVKKSDE